MSTSKNRRSVIVGIFILIAIVILIVAVFTLGGERKTFSRKIPVKAMFNDVSGLKQGDNVWFSGVKVGTVKTLELKPNSKVELTLSIEEKSQPFIRQDAKAKIGSEGLIGNRIVVIYGGTSAAPEVKDGQFLQTEELTSTDDMLATLQENNKNLVEITRNFKIISDRIANGEGSIGRLLSDNTLASNLESTVANFRSTSVKTQRMMSDLSVFVAQLNDSANTIHQLLNDTIMVNTLRGTMVQLREASYTASQFANNLNKASEQLNNSNGPAGVLLNDADVAQQMRNTIHNLETSSQKLDEDLEALQHNFLLRGFFKKKEKNKQ